MVKMKESIKKRKEKKTKERRKNKKIKVKKNPKILVLKSLDYLFNSALKIDDKDLQKELIIQAENYSKKHKVRIPYKYRVLYCKNCKTIYKESIRRIKNLKYKTLNITCENCGFLRRVNLEKLREEE